MMKLLIVEDNARMRGLLRSVVADLCESVTECADGARALGAFDDCRPDWVLMDVRMPGLDGISATGRIREAFPAARVVIVTGYDDAKLRRAASAAGACAYVLKEDLFELRRVLAPAGL